jgi:sporulation protein YlmC with PRC-barrel domain
MLLKSIVGKRVIDAAGDDLGTVDNIEFDWETKTITALVIEGDPKIKQRLFDSKYAKQIFGKLGAQVDPDIHIPVADVQVIGEVITLSTDIK